MDLSAEKLDLIRWITELKDLSVLKSIQVLRQKSVSSDWADELSEDEILGIKQGLQDLKDGNVVDHSEALKIYGKWL